MPQLRDRQGRFTSIEKLTPNLQALKKTLDDYPYSDENPIKIGAGVRLAVWLSHNRATILFYTLYVLLCFCIGLIGGFLGARQGLR